MSYIGNQIREQVSIASESSRRHAVNVLIQCLDAASGELAYLNNRIDDEGEAPAAIIADLHDEMAEVVRLCRTADDVQDALEEAEKCHDRLKRVARERLLELDAVAP